MNNSSIISDWRFLAAMTILCWGAYGVILKATSKDAAWQLSMVYFVFAYAAGVGIYCLFDMPDAKTGYFSAIYLHPAIAGLLCALGAITFFRALPMAPGSLLMPLVGLYVLVSSVGCLIFLKEPVSPRVIAGIVCAVVAIILLGK